MIKWFLIDVLIYMGIWACAFLLSVISAIVIIFIRNKVHAGYRAASRAKLRKKARAK